MEPDRYYIPPPLGYRKIEPKPRLSLHIKELFLINLSFYCSPTLFCDTGTYWKLYLIYSKCTVSQKSLRCIDVFFYIFPMWSGLEPFMNNPSRLFPIFSSDLFSKSPNSFFLFTKRKMWLLNAYIFRICLLWCQMSVTTLRIFTLTYI